MFNDLNFWRGILTVLAFLCFIGIIVWAWWGGRNRGFDKAAELPFDENEPPHSRQAERRTEDKHHE